MSFQNNKLKKLIIAAMFGAIICVVTMVVKIPLPLGGYVHLGDAFIILAGLYLGLRWNCGRNRLNACGCFYWICHSSAQYEFR